MKDEKNVWSLKIDNNMPLAHVHSSDNNCVARSSSLFFCQAKRRSPAAFFLDLSIMI